MGCTTTKDTRNNPITLKVTEKKNSLSALPGTQLSLGEGTSVVPTSQGKILRKIKVVILFIEIGTLKEFNYVYTDFIGEKTGKITDYYTLLSPPIGKGISFEVFRIVNKF